MNVYRQASSAVVRAPAKLNLFFEVLGRRGDGYHEIETLMVPVSLYDTLFAWADASGRIRLDCRWAGADSSSEALGRLPPEHENLAMRAVELLRTRAGVEAGLALRLVKRIPSASGLGGGSSDAAAALLAANYVWRLGFSRERLALLATELGSDVPFFLVGGAAIGRGRGERLEAVANLLPLHFVVVRPPEGLSTAEVYSQCQVAREPRSAARLVEALRSGDTRNLRRLMYNRLEGAAESLSPWIGRIRRELSRQDCLAEQMTGSGTAYFGICRHARHARRVLGRLQARGLGRVFSVRASH
ncbi:MAG: 4-(cytidine 5'-diphospho)-2-C-methyl-D-erythritol kinase [Pirellulales bacterium]